MLDTKALLTKIVNVFVGGTDNGWNYKKYPDGTYEAWKGIPLNIARSTAYGALYRCLEQTVQLPSFNSGTDYTIVGSSNGGDFVVFNTMSATSVGFFFVRTSTATAQDRVARLYLHGKY